MKVSKIMKRTILAVMLLAATPAMANHYHFDDYAWTATKNYQPIDLQFAVPAISENLGIDPLYIVFGKSETHYKVCTPWAEENGDKELAPIDPIKKGQLRFLGVDEIAMWQKTALASKAQTPCFMKMYNFYNDLGLLSE